MKKDQPEASKGRINNKSTSGQKRAALRKRAEQALRDTEARYQSLVDLGPDAILVHAAGKYVYANQAGTRLFGAHSSEEVIGSDVLESIHPDHRQSMVHRIEEACGGAVTPQELHPDHRSSSHSAGLFTATKIRAAEISRPDEELRMCRCDHDTIAAVGHQFVLQSYDTAAYLLPLSREVHKQLPLTLNPTYRGPPALF